MSSWRDLMYATGHDNYPDDDIFSVPPVCNICGQELDWIVCSACGGDGATDWNGLDMCTNCGGTGEVSRCPTCDYVDATAPSAAVEGK